MIYLNGTDTIVAFNGQLYLAETGFGGWGIFHRNTPTGRGVQLCDGRQRQQMVKALQVVAQYIEEDGGKHDLMINVRDVPLMVDEAFPEEVQL